jgi:SpoVK/Ycf46/Vps4 family AAA+-type ATPase
LEAWKEGANQKNQEYDSDYDNEFEEEDDDNEDDGDFFESRLAKLFLLFGESGTGKSASVYACAKELGFKVIEINASQSRSGKQVMEIIGEATQSTRVNLHKKPAHESKQKQKKRKRKRLRLDMKNSNHPTSVSHLSIVFFEDVSSC